MTAPDKSAAVVQGSILRRIVPQWRAAANINAKNSRTTHVIVNPAGATTG
ncbi:MAG: hypothetical protein R3D32_05175 [Nitratireductor sp.]